MRYLSNLHIFANHLVMNDEKKLKWYLNKCPFLRLRTHFRAVFVTPEQINEHIRHSKVCRCQSPEFDQSMVNVALIMLVHFCFINMYLNLTCDLL